MKTLYDVQQLLKKFGTYVYVGKRLWDIEVMALEIDHLHDADLISKKQFIQSKLVLNHEHKIEENKANNKSHLGGI
ncbi:YqgQ family protein [Apilactobacillus xinyiensis]|uniref:YqgQ family protein n=1 Tax=Apilactobacillus xinyiensis TaxID=2841032 RepID=UPI001C7CD009|nr:YqgQ family protein [Apilactobacillus xinyiensis]